MHTTYAPTAHGHVSGYHSCIILVFGFHLVQFFSVSIVHQTQQKMQLVIVGLNIHSNVKHFERNFVIPITEMQIDCGNHDSTNTETMDIDIDL